MSKKPSGSQFRKKRLQQEKFVESQRDALLSYVHPQQTDNFHDLSQLNEAASNHMLIDVENETANEPTVQNVFECEASVFELDDIVPDASVEELSENIHVNALSFNNPKTWIDEKEAIISKVRKLLVEHGPMSGEKADYSESLSEDGRRFTNEWFYKRMNNGEKLKRK